MHRPIHRLVSAALGDGTADLACDDRGRGPAILFLHGLACGRRAWQRHALRFARSHRTLSFDFPGHGDSSTPAHAGAWSEAAFVAAALAVLDAAGVDRAIVVGHSLGGGIALEMAIRHPERVDALLAIDAGSGSDDVAGYRRRAAALAELIESKGLEAYAEAVIASPTMRDYAQRGERARRHLHALIARNDPAGLVRTIRGVNLTRPAMPARALESIRCPTLVLNGALDEPCLASGRDAAQRIPGARLVEQPGTGHMLPLEAPRAVDVALQRLLASTR